MPSKLLFWLFIWLINFIYTFFAIDVEDIIICSREKRKKRMKARAISNLYILYLSIIHTKNLVQTCNDWVTWHGTQPHPSNSTKSWIQLISKTPPPSGLAQDLRPVSTTPPPPKTVAPEGATSYYAEGVTSYYAEGVTSYYAEDGTSYYAEVGTSYYAWASSRTMGYW